VCFKYNSFVAQSQPGLAEKERCGPGVPTDLFSRTAYSGNFEVVSLIQKDRSSGTMRAFISAFHWR
jgi:hypothetical protein